MPSSPAVGNLSYTVAQIRDAYGLNSIPNFGSTPADGSGQTIALVEAGNDPSIITDLDGFDQAMSLTTDIDRDAVPAVRARIVVRQCV